MLLRLGIMVGECTTTEHRMYLYGSNAYKFIREIGFVSKWKNERGMVCTRDQEAKTVIPVSKEWTKNTKKKLNRSAYNNAISRGTLSRMNAKEAGLTELLQWHYVKVRSLEYVECPSMCIEVPDGHRFLQNGFPHGNCQGSEFDNVVVVEQRCKMWDHARWAYTAASRAKSRLTWVIDR